MPQVPGIYQVTVVPFQTDGPDVKICLAGKIEANIHLPTDCMISSNRGAAKSGLR